MTENDGIVDELEVEDNNTERNFIEGDFEPMMAPTQWWDQNVAL